MVSVAALAVIYDLTGFFSGHHRSGAHLALVTLIVAFPLTFLGVFFNTAIAAAVVGVLEGRRPSVREALAVPVRRIGQVAMWSLLVSVVGIVIEQIARRLPLVGSLAVRLLGLSWSLATLFAVPILATEGCSAPECLRRSAKLVKKRWGEGIGGNVIITAWAVVAALAVVLVLGIAAGLSRGAAGVKIGAFAVAAIVFALILALSGVIRQTFDVVLYRYAVSGSAPDGFSASDLQAPFSKGMVSERGRDSSARDTGPSWRWAGVWPWLVSAALAGGFVLLVEVNKHHWRAHPVSARIVAGVLIWLALMTLVRFLIWAGNRLVRL